MRGCRFVAGLMGLLVLGVCPALLGAEQGSAESPGPSGESETGEQSFLPAPASVRLVAGPWTRLTLLGWSDFAWISGGGGGFLFGGHLLLQGIAYSTSSREVPGEAGRDFQLNGGGALVGWLVSPQSKVHAHLGALLTSTGANTTATHDANDTETLSWFALEPYAEVEATLYPGLRVFAGGGYRFLFGEDRRAELDSSYLSGPSLEFGFRMGG